MIGEVMIWPVPWVPEGFLICNGRKVPRTAYPELYAAIGDRFGGDADKFALPDLRGRMAMGAAPARHLEAGARGGVAKVALTLDEMPSHSHKLRFGAGGDRSAPAGAHLAENWRVQGGGSQLAAAAVGQEGQAEPHDNMPPFLVSQFAIRARAASRDQPVVGEIRLFAGTDPPAGFLPCDGRELEIEDHQALFHLLGPASQVGDKRLRLPELGARFVCGADPEGTNGVRVAMGERGGAARVALDAATLASHGHSLRAARKGTPGSPAGRVPAGGAAGSFAGQMGSRSEAMLGPAGGGRDHENLPPFLVLEYLICVAGAFPMLS